MATYMDAVNGKHTDGREQDVNSSQVRYVHIVQVHPVENGLPNLAKVVEEREFDNVDDARIFRMKHNLDPNQDRHGYPTEAVYLGRVNHETGELE